MKYLLDTHALLWIVEDNENLSKQVKEIYLDPANDIYLSTASLWEMAIKINLDKLQLEEELTKFVHKHVIGNNIEILNVKPEHVDPLVTLPVHHRDPFDRLLISQCTKERMALISKDKTFDKYAVERIW